MIIFLVLNQQRSTSVQLIYSNLSERKIRQTAVPRSQRLTHRHPNPNNIPNTIQRTEQQRSHTVQKNHYSRNYICTPYIYIYQKQQLQYSISHLMIRKPVVEAVVVPGEVLVVFKLFIQYRLQIQESHKRTICR